MSKRGGEELWECKCGSLFVTATPKNSRNVMVACGVCHAEMVQRAHFHLGPAMRMAEALDAWIEATRRLDAAQAEVLIA